ncbi:TM109 protein, partial [Crypturellus undulatus]|nr:TM109 protein [Crypturellus undulatus]
RRPVCVPPQGLSAALWTVSLGVSAALATLCRILGDVLAALGLDGDALRSAALGPGEVQRLLLWGLAALLCSWLLSRLLAPLLDLLVSALWWVKLCCFLRAFLYVVSSRQSPTVQAGLLLALWALHALLGRLAGTRGPGARLEAAVRSLEWQVEELRRRQK